MKKLIILTVISALTIGLSACGKEQNALVRGVDDSMTEITTQVTTEITTEKKQQMQVQGVDIVEDETPKHQYRNGSWEAEMEFWQAMLTAKQGADGKKLYWLEKDLEILKKRLDRITQPDESQWLYEGEIEGVQDAIELTKHDIANYQKELDPILEKIAELEAIPEDER